MKSFNYFLYDNLTWSAQTGRDWGIKAATGTLATRTDLKTDFLRYCSAMPADQGKLAAFGEAIGGIRPRNGKGYLLCVTLESADPFGRPSWAVYGLWCPDVTALEHLLANPVGAVKGVLRLTEPPNAIHAHGGAAAVRPVRRTSTATTFHRFATTATATEVTAILLGAIRGNTTLPNILGITGTSRLSALATAGFDRVYCHAMDDQAERALARQLSSPDLQELEPPPIATSVLRAYPSRDPLPPRPGKINRFVLAAATALAVVIAASLFVHSASQESGEWQIVDAEEADLGGSDGAPAGTQPSQFMNQRPSVALEELHRSLEEFRHLDPAALQRSRGFHVATTVPVIAKQYDHERKRVRDAFKTLLEVRDRMIKRRTTYVAYYYDLPDGPNAPSAAIRLEKIRRILREKPLGGEACATLRRSFGFEFEHSDSAVRRWCEASVRLEARAGLMERPSSTGSK